VNNALKSVDTRWRTLLFSRFLRFFPALICVLFAWTSCRSTPGETILPTEIRLPPPPASNGAGGVFTPAPVPPPPAPAGTAATATAPTTGSIVEQIRFHTERGTPSSIQEALEIISSRNLGGTEHGRMMNFINSTLMRTLYPSIQVQLPPTDPPLIHIYAVILREAERGIYTVPRPNSTNYLELVLPFLAYYPDRNRNVDGSRRPGTAERHIPPERFLAALPDLRFAAALNEGSVLAGYFIAVVYEQTGAFDDALRQYAHMWDLFPEFFPAPLAIARIMQAQGRNQELLPFLLDLSRHFPGNLQIVRQVALAHYRAGNWAQATPAIDTVLQQNPRNAEFVLMRAHILVQQRQFLRAQEALDFYASISPVNAFHQFLRARVNAEGFNNREAALNYLRAILRTPPAAANGHIHNEAMLYAVRLLMASPHPADHSEGRVLLARLLDVPAPPLEVLALALDDAIRQEAWVPARLYLNRLLAERRSFGDLLAAFTLERAQGNSAAALAFARELRTLEPANEEAAIAYITALIDNGALTNASTLIHSRLAAIPSGSLRSRYLFLRSRLHQSEEQQLSDLRASLFEDPRNVDSLIAMFEIHHLRGDGRRAVHYLRQAIALAPDNPRLRRYQAEYALVPGSGF